MLALIPTMSAIALFLVVMLYAGIRDATTMTIPNALVVALVVAYGLLSPLSGFSAAEMGWSAGVALVVLLGGFILFSLGWIGGGDAKFAAATALWLGPNLAPAYLVYTAIFGGVLTLALLGFRQFPIPAGLLAPSWLARLRSVESGIPYGVALSTAALALFPHTHWVLSLSRATL